MASHEPTNEEKLKRFLFTNSVNANFVTGDYDKHPCIISAGRCFELFKTNHSDFLKTLFSVNDEPLLTRRGNIFYIIALFLHCEDISNDIKLELKEAVLKLIKRDEDFFDFLRYFTLHSKKEKHKITTQLKKVIFKFYHNKTPEQFAESVAGHYGFHGFSHKDLFRFCHFKCVNVECEPILKFALFGVKELPDSGDSEAKKIIEYLRKSHELRTTENVERAVQLMHDLKVGVERVNSKLNKNENIWLAALFHMTTRQVLQNLYNFYKAGFLKNGTPFLMKINEVLQNEEKIRSCNLHPLEVYIYMKFFEKGGKVLDPKLLNYLQEAKIKEETLKKITTPNEPKCKPVLQNLNRCLKISYKHINATGKNIFITIDVTNKAEEVCFHNKRITFLEAAVAVAKFFFKVESYVNVAVFKDGQINFVDVSKAHTAIEKLQEHKAAYIFPAAPIEWAKNKKKKIDVFINFVACGWYANVPLDEKPKMEKLSVALNNYAKKMKLPDVKVVQFYLGGLSSTPMENSKNVLSISGFTAEVPSVLEAFIRGTFS